MVVLEQSNDDMIQQNSQENEDKLRLRESYKHVRQVVMSKKDIDKRLKQLFEANFDNQQTKIGNDAEEMSVKAPNDKANRK